VAELKEVRSLRQLLDQEYEILSSADDPSRIEQISVEKLELIRRVDNLFGIRNRFLQEAGLSTADDLQSLLDELPATSELAQRFGALEEAVKEMHRQNQINGNIVSHGQRYVRQTLDILHGKSETLQTYGPEGEARSEERANFSSKV
jgi:flagellar biosynthesis/type III secretory pathway chaperone